MNADAALLGRDFDDLGGPLAVPVTPGGERARRHVLQRLGEGSYRLEAVPCYCGQRADVTLATVDRYRLPNRTVLCRACGLVRIDPRLDERSFADFYRQHYRAIYERPGQDPGVLFERQSRNAHRRHRFVVQSGLVAAGDSILEIGCGAGWNLWPFHRAGYPAMGYDYDETYLEHGRRRGLDLRGGGLDAAEADGKQYRVVILSHVLEHFVDPVGAVTRIARLLSGDGVIYVEVPSVFSIGGNVLRNLQGAHTYSFVPGSLENVMRAAGCRRLVATRYIESLWRPGAVPAASWKRDPALAGRIVDHLAAVQRHPRLVSLRNRAALRLDRLRARFIPPLGNRRGEAT